MHFENRGQRHPQKIIMPTFNSSIFLTNSSDYDSADDASSCSHSSSISSSSSLASKCSSAKSSASSSSSSLSSRQCPSNDSSLNFSSSSSASSQNPASQPRDQSTNSTSSRQQPQVEIEMLDLLKTSYGPSSPKIAQHLNSLALRHFHTSNDASASLACHREALSILEWNRSHALLFDREEDSKRFAVEMAVTLSDMANVLREGNDFLGSGEAYLESLNLFLDGVVKDGGVIRRVLEEVPLQMTMQMVVGSRSSDDAAAAAFARAENDALETNWSMENNGPDILSNTSSPYPSEEEGRLRRQMQHQIHLERATLEREIIGINLAEIGTTLSSHPEVQRALRGIDQLLREMQYVKFVAQNAASSRRRRRCIQKSVVTSNLTSAIASLNMMSSTATATATTQRMDSSSFSDLGRSVSDADFILEEDDEEDMTLCPPLPSHQYRSTPYLHQVHHQRNLPQDRRIRNYNHYRSSSSSCYPDSCEASPGAATIGESTPVSRPLLPASSRFRTRVGGRGDASTSSSSDLRIVHLQRSKSWASTHSTQEEFQRFFSSAGCDNYPPIGQDYYPYHGHDGYDNDEGSSKNIINRSLSNPQRQSSYPSHGIHHYPRRNSYNNPKLYYTLDNSNRNRYFCYPFRRPNLLARRAITSEEDYDRHVALSVLIIPLENALRCALHRFPGLVNLTNGGGVGRSFSGHPYSSSLSLQGLVDHVHDRDCDTARIGSYEFNLRNKATSTKRSEDTASIHDDEKGHDPMIPSILPKSFTHDESQTHQPIEHDPDVAVRAKDTDELRPKEVIATIGLPMDGFLEKDSKIISTITNPSSSSSPSAVAVGTSGNSSTTHHTAHYQNPAVANIITANKNHPLIISQLSSTPEDGSCMTSPRTTAKIELNYTIPCGGASPRD